MTKSRGGGHTETLEFHTVSGADIIDQFGYRECPAR